MATLSSPPPTYQQPTFPSYTLVFPLHIDAIFLIQFNFYIYTIDPRQPKTAPMHGTQWVDFPTLQDIDGKIVRKGVGIEGVEDRPVEPLP